jgi:hypothetical protein
VIPTSRRSHRFFNFTLASLIRLPLFLLPLLAAAGGCKVNQQAFESRIFSCDTTSPDPRCGTDAAGNPLTCFAARRIGGSDFCTKACTDPGPVSDDNAICVQNGKGGAELPFCSPSDDGDPADHPLGACDRSELGCLRTNVEPGANEGVCITGNPCVQDTDCKDPVRSTCAATFLKDLYQGAKDELAADHLYCLQEGCQANNQACSPGETCLKFVVPAAANPPDICVPNCDSNGRCPPNHFCLSRVSGPANPKVCIPGLLGFVCETDVDCLVGTCQSDDPDHPELALSLCTISCAGDADCAKYDSAQGNFVCSAGPTHRHCVTPSAYTGTLCNTSQDCGMRDKQGTQCSRVSPDDKQGTCLIPCNADGSCAPRDGVGHTCLPFAGDDGKPVNVCFPGNFSYPCFADAQCAVAELKCAGADLHDPANPVPGLCTRLCATDTDCQQDVWVGAGSYCGGDTVSICLPLGADGTPCTAGKQCASKVCAVPPTAPGAMMSMTKVCGGVSP